MLSYEHSLVALNEQSEALLANKPTEPAKPSPPTIQAPAFEPIPYPNIAVPDFGMSPWYRWAIVCIIASVIAFVFSFVIGTTTLTSSYGDISTASYIGGLSGFLVWLAIALAIKGFLGNDNRSEKYIKRMQNSPKYKQQCAQIDAQNAVLYQNAAFQAQRSYKQNCMDYEKKIIPNYQMCLQEYEATLLPQWEQSLSSLQNEILQTQQNLDQAYAANILPYEYRNLDALEFLARYMESSQCDLQTAIAQYEKTKSDELIREMIASQEDQAYEMQQLIAEQQQTIGELQDQLSETQRAANSAKHWSMANTALSGYTAYKTRKIGKKLEEDSD